MHQNRRNFLQLGAISLFTLSSNSNLFAGTKIITKEDLYIAKKDYDVFQSVRNKLKLVQTYIGYGNFNIINLDTMLRISKNASNIEEFTKAEIDFLEFIFYYNPSSHGFFGERISNNITDTIDKKIITKIPRTGHYLFKGKAEKTYYEMTNDVGSSLTLTSGIRSIVKQTKLFLDKINAVEGNISVAAKSIAPPAFTYHAIGDFDVGKKGFGYANFTSRFANTNEFKKIKELKYVDVRYTINNKDGVRYEPWHITTI
ncbi:D-alanyl-D-alanine carboxypeptidase family protein [Poseidonibacter ostreae]|jgi:zinc D-Ala-D-Ala carboxypeptidase|uniref:D-alanyl-D-alanine carboxypeptidase-like core domain-containing protein n=1 Tax=Poseidonibacter ostreae TaxID=2654171 RepID=A0A6L4WQV3_9BACT|nr:D-alanyl-D-alanine carboxypeptidase family protein [Poseidonibacter ostreae]KAB7884740.1 hypothetical protein GA417_10700 [Poseidonibacter ostreae]KAB7887027.1 hypothetical protein GBG19_11225 [Poseidonibacter ostreae]KAB7891998.1 hypothetical protein GBG18_04380 [Poseidonibacter ostreae]